MRVFVLLTLIAGCSAFYLPGVAPRDYADGEPVDLKVNKLDSVKTQLPYDYYSLEFCKPEKVVAASENLGEVLSGDDIENSAYEIFMQQTDACKILCRKVYTENQFSAFRDKVMHDYHANWIIDNMPAATRYYTALVGDEQNLQEHYAKGFPLGSVNDGTPYLNNHHRLQIFFHQDSSYSGFRIVGFEVQPFSVQHQINGEWKGSATKLATCTPMNQVSKSSPPLSIGLEDSKEVIWTYDIMWLESDVKWASRWDLYLKMSETQIHWFSMLNSVIIVVFMTGVIAMIMVRTLCRDLANYNDDEENLSEEELQDKHAEETGWKLIHGDVFRPPQAGALFAVLVGTGAQVCGMTVVLLIFAALGFLSPANRGGLMTAMLLLFVAMGAVAGYFSTRVYTMFKLTSVNRNSLMTALLGPGTIFAGFFILNLFVWGEKSSGAVPFTTLVVLLLLWFGISVPLVYLGSWGAQKRAPIEHPVRVNNIPREIPERAWHRGMWSGILAGGVMPFSAVFIELYFILSSVWLHQVYYVFGILLLVFGILILTCAEVSIVMTYFQLCSEDYRWWWSSFLASGSSAFYLFLYSTYYFFTQLEITGFVSILLFFGYMFLASLVFFVLTGSLGFFGSYMFVRKIYSAVKID